MSRNESRNGAVHIVSISMTLKTLINQQHSSSKKPKHCYRQSSQMALKISGPWYTQAFFQELPVIQSNTNLCPAMKEFCRHNLSLKSDREIGWS